MKTWSMMSSTLLIPVILAVSFLPFGYSLKCYYSVCTNSSQAPGVTQCSVEPQEVNCTGTPGIPLAHDRCFTQRAMIEQPNPLGGVIIIHQEIRYCLYSFQCIPSAFEVACNALNTSGLMKKCEIGCCEGDMCNSGGSIPTQAPGPPRPSGADLSCLACSTVPTLGVQRDCNTPVSQTCGDSQIPGVPQDRCMSVKAVAKVPGFLQPMEYRMKNCSDAVTCNQEALCASANASVNASVGGVLESCQVSCCFGNDCNRDMTTTAAISPTTAAGTQPGGTAGTQPGGTAGTTPGGTAVPSVPSTALTCFAALISYFYFRPVMA